MRIILVEGDRKQGAFDNRIVSWRFKIILNTRCVGLLSARVYKTPDLAHAAGERMMKKLLTINNV